ncbi:MAG: TetR/AcrR family transcriptional regulator [Hyphomonadaceae bacterium]|jgi:AcrR family transcriptional regulator|nr:TetR/AcrR family transcriptional regulator [Hyphomonadaceae bacterium]
MHGEVDATARWIEAGLAELAAGGIERVRVEVVAERLGVTKGGFYRRFKDRRALLDGILETWSRGRTAAIDQQLALGDATPGQRLKAVIKLYSERVNAQGMAIELAIRQWARTDQAAAAAVARVDAHRLRNVESLYGRMGLSAEDARARAVLFYSFIFGQSLLFLDQAPAKRASLIAACSNALTEIDASSS